MPLSILRPSGLKQSAPILSPALIRPCPCPCPCPGALLSHFLLILAPHLPCPCLSRPLCSSGFLSCCLPAPLLCSPLPNPQQQAVTILEEAPQALLGFGVWDGSDSVGGEGGPQGSAQHQDQRAPHGQEGRAAGRVRGQRPRPLPTPSPPPVCPGAPRPPPHLPAGLLSSGHWPLAPQRLLDPNTSLRSSLCSFRCLFEPQPSSTADHAPGPSPALGHAHPTLPRPCPQDWPRLDASTTPRAKASLHPPPRLYLGLAPSTLAFLNLSSGRPPSSAWGALPRTAPERSPSHFASLLLVTTVHCPKAMVSSVLSNFLV